MHFDDPSNQMVRNRVFNDAHGRCLRCGVPLLMGHDPNHPRTMNIDHVIPKSWGGLDVYANYQALCRGCSLSKGNRSAADYRNPGNYQGGGIARPGRLLEPVNVRRIKWAVAFGISRAALGAGLPSEFHALLFFVMLGGILFGYGRKGASRALYVQAVVLAVLWGALGSTAPGLMFLSIAASALSGYVVAAFSWTAFRSALSGMRSPSRKPDAPVFPHPNASHTPFGPGGY